MTRPRIVALALVTQHELDRLGPAFDRAYPVDEAPCFNELLRAIDEADRQLWRGRDEERLSDPMGEAWQPAPAVDSD